LVVLLLALVYTDERSAIGRRRRALVLISVVAIAQGRQQQQARIISIESDDHRPLHPSNGSAVRLARSRGRLL